MHNAKRKPELRATAKSLAEQRAEAVKEMQDILTASKTEARAITDEENTKLEGLEKTVKDIDRTMEAERRSLELLKAVPEPKKGDEGTRAEEPGTNEKKLTVTAEDKRAFMDIVESKIERRSGEQNFNMGNNGALIPQSIAHLVITKVQEICPIFAGADRYAVKGTLKLPVYGPKKVDNVDHDITVGYSDEFTELAADAGAFTSIDLTGYLAGALTLIGRSLINNSEIPVFDKIIEQMALKIALWIERECLNGTLNKCQGALSTTNVVHAGSVSAITADKLIELQAAVPTKYQPKACWTMHPDTFTAIRKLKDSSGQYLLQQNGGIVNAFPYTLLGKPVYLSDNMPVIASAAKAVLYGDYKGLAVNMRENMSIEVLREKYATMHAIGIVAWFEIDSKIENAQMLAALSMTTAA